MMTNPSSVLQYLDYFFWKSRHKIWLQRNFSFFGKCLHLVRQNYWSMIFTTYFIQRRSKIKQLIYKPFWIGKQEQAWGMLFHTRANELQVYVFAWSWYTSVVISIIVVMIVVLILILVFPVVPIIPPHFRYDVFLDVQQLPI